MEYIELRNIVKSFFGVKALDGVSLSIKKGEVHAVVGENGAGKSTIMKILGGLYFADGGDIYIDGTRRNINSVAAALKNGISVVYQELHLMPDLTVAENIFLHGLPSRAGMVDKKALNRRAQALLDDMNVSIKATDQISLLSVSQQQMVEIAKALSHDAEIIIMDEPTAALNVSEVEALYGVIRRLRENGKTVIYISHRLKEIFDVTDRVSVLRDGRYIGTRATGDIGQDELVAMMVGRELSQFYTTSDHAYGEPVLEVRGLSRDGLFSDISFTLHKGELLGVAGLMGCRKEEIFQSLYGLYAPDAGEIALNGRTVFSAAQGVNLISSPRKAMGIGIGYVTEDRKGSGVFALMTCRENLTISVLRQLSGAGIIRGQSEDDLLDGYTRKMNMKYSGHRQRMNSLSGGNQQKFLLARTLAANCSVLIMLEPTRGIDVGAKAEIYSLLEELAREGLSVIIVSSELSEIIGNCHRALVIFQGGLTGVIEKGEFDETLIMQYATGNLTKLGAGRRAG